MEEVVILKRDGRPVKLTEAFTNLIFDIDGFLTEFNFEGEKYRYYQYDDFKKADTYHNGLSGYFDEEAYLLYIQYVGSEVPTAQELTQVEKFNFDGYIASENDVITVKTVDFDPPYDYYFKEKTSTFNIEIDPFTNQVKNYYDIITKGITIPADAVVNQIFKDLNSNPRGLFFEKNFGVSVNSWTVNDRIKKAFCRLTTLMAFRINDIYSKIFPTIVSNETRTAIDNFVNDPNGDITTLSDFEKTIFTLEKSWGYYYDPQSTLPHKQDFDAVLSNTADEEEYQDYLLSLDNFYTIIYKIKDLLADKLDIFKIGILIELMPSAVLSLIPLEYRIYTLKELAKLPIPSSRERLVLKIIYSVTASDADYFLNFLLEKNNGETYFEILYGKMDDDRLGRYPFMILTDKAENRMHFVTGVYELWKSSRYSFYLPNGQINLNSFFFNEGKTLYSQDANGKAKQTVFEFGLTDSYSIPDPDIPNLTRFQTTWANYKCEKGMKGELIPVQKSLDYVKYYENKFGNRVGSSIDAGSKTLEIDYHMYFPISIAGHSTEGVKIPEGIGVPMFLFYYTKDFKKLQKIDAAINLGIEIGLEAVLFFTIGGGLSTLRHIRHVRQLLNIEAAISGGMAAEETVLIFTGLEASAETISVSAAVMGSLGTYNATQIENPILKQQQIETNKTFFYIALASGGFASLFKYKAVQSADNVITSIEGGVYNNIPDDVYEVLIDLRGQRNVAIAQFQGSLTDYENISFKLTSYTPEVKVRFWEDFKDNTDSFFERLNGDVDYMDNWEDLYLLDVDERKVIDFITNTQLTNRMYKYYEEIELRKILEPLDYNLKKSFFDDFGGVNDVVFNNLVQESEKINLPVEFSRRTITGADKFDEASEIIDILEADLNVNHIKLLAEKCLVKFGDGSVLYDQMINNIIYEPQYIKQIHDGSLFSFYDTLSNNKKNNLRAKNVYKATIEKFIGDTPVGNPIVEVYVSGNQASVSRVFDGIQPTTLAENFIRDIEDYDSFEMFAMKALDLSEAEVKTRINDTEIKFIFNFLKEHWDSADTFVINATSKLYTCSSCQIYYVYLQQLAAKEGKLIKFNVLSNPGIKTVSQINKQSN